MCSLPAARRPNSPCAEAAPAAPLRFLAAGLAAAAVATCSPAEAGVVLVQPEVKNFVKGTTPAAKTPEEKKAAAPKAKKQEEASAPGSGFEAFRPLVLPLSLLFVGGAGAAAIKADPEFASRLDESWGSRNSNVVGVGYETAPGLKDTPFFGGDNTTGPKGAAPKVRGAAGAWQWWPGRWAFVAADWLPGCGRLQWYCAHWHAQQGASALLVWASETHAGSLFAQ